jgi:rare lipoprotein A
MFNNQISYIQNILSSRPVSRLILLLCSFCITTSCTSYQRAYTQQREHTARPVATQKPYVVDGKRYEPLSSHEGFEQEGIASSYGLEFQGRKTSNGETFDMNAMTAAHKTLPMGVYVRVQHKQSGREVVVRINDRGPFAKDRIIDLSDAAASRLGIIQEGLAPVKVSALGYKTEGVGGLSSYRQPMSYDSGSFALQVGAFTIKANASRYAEELRRKFGAADIQEAIVSGTKYYRVRLGHYSSLRIAQSAQEQYERKGFNNNFVVSLD